MNDLEICAFLSSSVAVLEEPTIKLKAADHDGDPIEDFTDVSVEDVVSEVKSLNVENEENLDNRLAVD